MEKAQTKTVILGFNSCQMDEMFTTHSDVPRVDEISVDTIFNQASPREREEEKTDWEEGDGKREEKHLDRGIVTDRNCEKEEA